MKLKYMLTERMGARQWAPVNLVVALLEKGIEVSPRTVERWMDGETEPKVSTSIVLSKILEFDMAALT